MHVPITRNHAADVFNILQCSDEKSNESLQVCNRRAVAPTGHSLITCTFIFIDDGCVCVCVCELARGTKCAFLVRWYHISIISTHRHNVNILPDARGINSPMCLCLRFNITHTHTHIANRKRKEAAARVSRLPTEKCSSPGLWERNEHDQQAGRRAPARRLFTSDAHESAAIPNNIKPHPLQSSVAFPRTPPYRPPPPPTSFSGLSQTI